MSTIAENRRALPPPDTHPLLYLALLAATMATAGSLYMSEMFGWTPCRWCWFQRIAMYPLSVLLLVGIARRDRAIAGYSLLLAIPGLLAALWHIGIQKVPAITLQYVCTDGVPCSSDELFSLGLTPRWMTVPMLAAAAFAIIIVCCAIALLRKPAPRSEDEIVGLPPVTFAGAIVAAIGALYFVASTLGYGAPPPRANPLTTTAPTGSGQALFTQYCAACHVPAANGEYRNIRDSFVRGKSADDIAAFIKIGRAATSPDSVSKAAMPAYGGYPFLTDQEVATIAAFVLETAK